MFRPQPIQAADKIALVAPAGKINKEDIEDVIKYLKEWQLIPVLGKNIFNAFYLGYAYAGSDEERTFDFQEALDDDEIKAIWCIRGGYGTVKIIDQLDFSQFFKNPKWIIGYSDITVFHNHLNNLGIETLHGVTAKKLDINYHPDSYLSLKTVLFGENTTYTIPPYSLNREGKAKGILVGGNLSIIYSLLGSPSSIQGKNLILFLEDWQENWYHIDRMMMNLKRNGLFEKVNGFVLGSFTKMDLPNENPEYNAEFDSQAEEVINKIIEKYAVPIAFRFPAGHIGHNLALIFGREISLKITSKNVTLSF